MPETPETPAAQPPASSPLTLKGVRNRLVGVSGWLNAASECAGYDDEEIGNTILDAISDFEERAKFTIIPRQVSMAPDGRFPGSADMPVEEKAPLPFFRDSAQNFFAITLPHRPIQQIQRLRLMLGRQVVSEINPQTFTLDKDRGEFHLVWTSGAFGAGSASWWSAAAFSVSASNNQPACIAFDYIAGLPDGWQNDMRRRTLRRTLEEHAASYVLKDISELYDAGLLNSSTSTYGLSQQLNYSRFTERKKELSDSVDEFIDGFKQKNTGPTWSGV